MPLRKRPTVADSETDSRCRAQPLMSCRESPLRRDNSDCDRPHSRMIVAKFAAARRISSFTAWPEIGFDPLLYWSISTVLTGCRCPVHDSCKVFDNCRVRNAQVYMCNLAAPCHLWLCAPVVVSN